MDAIAIKADFLPLATAHKYFARWEQTSHRAHVFAVIHFPDSHPFRRALADAVADLESVRFEAECSLSTIVGKHGGFRGIVNGFFFENGETDLSKKDPKRYWDCPEDRFGKGVKRSRIMPLAGLVCIQLLGTCGQRTGHLDGEE